MLLAGNGNGCVPLDVVALDAMRLLLEVLGEVPPDDVTAISQSLLGKLVAKDEDSYRYLAESIRMHPDQQALKALMQGAGFGHVDVHDLNAGVVALHVGVKC